jgi:excisionase family DNA binding protein
MTESKFIRSTPVFLTPADVARQLNVSLNAVYNLIREGALRAVNLSPAGKSGERGFYRIRPTWLEDFLEQRGTTPAPAAKRAGLARRRRRSFDTLPPNYTGL